MDTQQPKPEIDLLRRVFVPREMRTTKGMMVFRTTDGEVYTRMFDGSIRRANPKVNGKVAKRERRAKREHR